VVPPTIEVTISRLEIRAEPDRFALAEHFLGDGGEIEQRDALIEKPLPRRMTY
jgi:hypothetical protein